MSTSTPIVTRRHVLSALLSFAMLCGQLSAQKAASNEQAAARPKIRVVATLPILADLARQVGGDQVEVRSLGKGWEDPHMILPTPSLMTAVSKADLFIELGLSLELWAEKVLDGARNPKIRRGAKGHVFASKGMPVLQVPGNLSRSEGDLHPDGNPHVWMDPARWGLLATQIEQGLERVAPARARRFQANLADFQHKVDIALYGKPLVELLGGKVLNRLALGGRLCNFIETKKYKGKPLSDSLGGWMKKALPLRGKKILFYHQSWVYFTNRYGLRVIDFVEEKPGIAPPASHKTKLLKEIRENAVRVLGQQTYYDDSIGKALAREAGIRVVILPGMPEAVPEAKDVFSFMDCILDRLLKAYGKE